MQHHLITIYINFVCRVPSETGMVQPVYLIWGQEKHHFHPTACTTQPLTSPQPACHSTLLEVPVSPKPALTSSIFAYIQPHISLIPHLTSSIPFFDSVKSSACVKFIPYLMCKERETPSVDVRHTAADTSVNSEGWLPIDF